MFERDMEELIANYPDDFFPNKGFELRGRQQSFAGVGRFDLLFQDRFKTNILMELKAVPAKYEVATQLAKYKDELRSRGEKHILMWLVAPQVSNSVREFLDRIGIEYSEIHETEFQLVADRHGSKIGPEVLPGAQAANPVSSLPTATPSKCEKETVLPSAHKFSETTKKIVSIAAEIGATTKEPTTGTLRSYLDDKPILRITRLTKELPVVYIRPKLNGKYGDFSKVTGVTQPELWKRVGGGSGAFEFVGTSPVDLFAGVQEYLSRARDIVASRTLSRRRSSVTTAGRVDDGGVLDR